MNEILKKENSQIKYNLDIIFTQLSNDNEISGFEERIFNSLIKFTNYTISDFKYNLSKEEQVKKIDSNDKKLIVDLILTLLQIIDCKSELEMERLEFPMLLSAIGGLDEYSVYREYVKKEGKYLTTFVRILILSLMTTIIKSNNLDNIKLNKIAKELNQVIDLKIINTELTRKDIIISKKFIPETLLERIRKIIISNNLVINEEFRNLFYKD